MSLCQLEYSSIATGSDSFGSIQAAELNWGNADHIRAVEPPFGYIIGTDVVSLLVVYVGHLLEPLLQTIVALSGPRTTIKLGYELRSTKMCSIKCRICGKETLSLKVFLNQRFGCSSNGFDCY